MSYGAAVSTSEFCQLFVAGNATYKSPCRSVGPSPFAFFAFLGILRAGKFVFEHAPAQINSAPAQIITAPAQIITAPAQLITAPAQPPATKVFDSLSTKVVVYTALFSVASAEKSDLCHERIKKPKSCTNHRQKCVLA